MLLILIAITIVLDIISFLLYKNSCNSYGEPILKVKHVILLYVVLLIFPPIAIVVSFCSIVAWAFGIENDDYKFNLLEKHPNIKEWLNKDIV